MPIRLEVIFILFTNLFNTGRTQSLAAKDNERKGKVQRTLITDHWDSVMKLCVLMCAEMSVKVVIYHCYYYTQCYYLRKR